ncbi:hypothetical protein NC651_024954 [Populus alba x Populus x berolinensis]|nr:hypothetical protein NC651_024945 [Populus alba x Populus x berolinensis]KAJ6891610.1 hypothetical protein NC651_024954 [Populus alba x Populus x berolinensis]
MDKAPCVLRSPPVDIYCLVLHASSPVTTDKSGKAASKLDNGGVWMIQQMFGRCC